MSKKKIILVFTALLFVLSTQAQKSDGNGNAESELNVFIPNAFTPNGDGLNDVFKPVVNGPELERYELTILDRNGKAVFSSTDPTTVWNGTVKGSDYLSTPSIFIYLLQLQTVDDPTVRTYTGHIVMIR